MPSMVVSRTYVTFSVCDFLLALRRAVRSESVSCIVYEPLAPLIAPALVMLPPSNSIETSHENEDGLL